MLPERGCEIYEFRDRSTGVDVLFKSPWGLQPPGAPPREGSEGMEFLHNYGGGWQELLPSCNDACTLPRRRAARSTARSRWRRGTSSVGERRAARRSS